MNDLYQYNSSPSIINSKITSKNTGDTLNKYINSSITSQQNNKYDVIQKHTSTNDDGIKSAIYDDGIKSTTNDDGIKSTTNNDGIKSTIYDNLKSYTNTGGKKRKTKKRKIKRRKTKRRKTKRRKYK